MRIALFSSTADPRDGYGNITVELSKELVSQSIDVTLFLPKSQREHAAKLDFPVTTQCVLPEYIFRIYQPKGLGYFRTVDLRGFDIVHDLFSFPYCIPAARSAKKYGIPYVVGAQGTHGVRPLTYIPERWFLLSAYKQAAAIQVPSVYTKEKILKHAGIDLTIDIIHNGVRFDRFQHNVDVEAIRKKFPGKKILLTVGGLWGRKGHDLVLRALAILRDKRTDIAYVMVGDGNGKEQLDALATELGVRDMVEFAGRKSGDELVAYFRACDIYVHTPKVVDLKFEGFGIVYLEASACGKPIVATDAGGVRDAVLDGKTGLIANDGDIVGIAERIEKLLDDPSLASQLGKSGKVYAKNNDWSEIGKQYIKLYERVSAKRTIN